MSEESMMDNTTESAFERPSNSTAILANTSLSPFIDDEMQYVPYEQRPETYIVPVVFAIIFVVGVLGNGSLILIFARHRRMRNVPNTYIFSLALGDLILIVSCVPFTSTLYTFESWPYGAFICKLSETVKDLSVGVSVFTLTALSAERYCAIVNPMRRHAGGILGSKTVTLCTAIGIWIVSLIFAVPSAVFSRLREHVLLNNHSVILYCYPLPGDIGDTPDKIVIVFKFLTYYAIPLCIITIFYVLMAVHLEKSARNMPGEAAHSTQVQARKKVAKMVLAFVVIFVICFLPYHVFMLWFHLNPDSMSEYDEFWNTLRIVGFCLSFLNSCINPIALYFVSGTFRKHFNRHLFCCCCPDEIPERTRRNTFDKSRRNDASSHTLVHFHSSVKRHHEVTVTTAFSLDKT
ncbi:neuropeptide CCHamide-1 receptor-like [Neocloeon triangulifer]|uniref:neuropeptide CCHamide-1 receptor-like n=1 Tax=Neocloeon triangulifer TaxID=2078957 RepID=UPI00286FAE8F|nr:neuropeptide CCHamide-1 receptor-like [Neocloeon triangulifer]